jgi:hypothetical protein
MGGRMRRTGIAVAALSLLLVAGQAPAAFADDRNATSSNYDSSWQGLDEQIHPVAPGASYDSSWQGLDEQIHPVAPGASYDSSWQGLDEQIHPVAPGARFDSSWQGLDEQIHPVAPGTVNADSTESVPSSSGSSNFPVFAVAFGLGLAALLGALVATAYRRRTRPATVG